jgi:hypothetical protein
LVASLAVPAAGLASSGGASTGGASPATGANGQQTGGVGIGGQHRTRRETASNRVERAHLDANGLAVAPPDAPAVIQAVIAAANKIAFKPYIYGGGHGTWNDSGYDCSGSVSYALHGGGLLSVTMDSTEFESYGSAGRGRWITIWANGGHAYMYIAGLRFDTSARSDTGGSRWTTAGRSGDGFVVRHPAGW